MRQRLAVLLLALMLVVAFGCTPSEDPNRLSIWEQMDPAQQAVLFRQLEVFESLHPGVQVETNHFETEKLRTQFQTAALAGSGPDLVYGPGDQVGPFSIMGLIEPLEELFPADSLAVFTEASFSTLDGHLYALADQVGNHLTLVYNKAYVDTPAQDTDAWFAQLVELTVDQDGDGKVDRYGLVMNLLEPFWFVPWLGAFGGWMMDENGEPTLDTPEVSAALRFVRDLVRLGVVPASCDYPLADTLFMQGRAAYIVNGPWSWQGYRDAGIQIGLADLPLVNATGRWPTPMTSPLGYSLNVNVPAVRRELVLELLSFLTSAPCIGEVSQELSALPSRRDVAQWPLIEGDSVLRASWSQLEKGRPMPIVPEMRVMWDVLRPAYQQVLSGSMQPEEAGPWMQSQALRKIEEMRR